MNRVLSMVCLVLLSSGCVVAAQDGGGAASQPQATTQPAGDEKEQRDPKADALAERVMKRLGGEKQWQQTRFITWNFFGMRTHTWDKSAMRDRIEYTDDDGREHVLIIDLETKAGRAWIAGNEVRDAMQLAELMTRAYAMWVNDSYWLVMPYKLRDDGVTLRHMGTRETAEGDEAEVLQLTFDDEAGLTPGNMYLVYVDPASELVVQWDYYERAQDRAPTLSTPWKDWKHYGGIWLSGDRGELRGNKATLTNIAVHREVPAWTFSRPHGQGAME